MPVAIYNQARPATFAGVLGQAGVTTTLQRQTINRSWGHSYLLYGPSGTGKTSTARILARVLTCQNLNGIGEPCGQCQSCRVALKGAHWDVIEIDAASHRGIDDVKDLKARAYLCPMGGQYKVYILDEAHQLTSPAWDALLKLLEEPPEHLVIILCSTRIESIPQTIISRCQVYEFVSLPDDVITRKLGIIAGYKGFQIDIAALKFIAATSGGNMRTAENQLDKMLSVR